MVESRWCGPKDPRCRIDPMVNTRPSSHRSFPPPRASLLGSPMRGRTGGEMVEETLRTVDVQLICVHLFTSYQHDEDQVQEKREQGLQGPASPFRTRTFGRGNEAFGGVWLEVQT